jgi:hypothetical protein
MRLTEAGNRAAVVSLLASKRGNTPVMRGEQTARSLRGQFCSLTCSFVRNSGSVATAGYAKRKADIRRIASSGGGLDCK